MAKSTEVGLTDIVQAAKQDTDESWEYVDQFLPDLSARDEVYEWALNEGLDNDDGNIQDLAASIFEYQETTLFEIILETHPEIKEKLTNVMSTSKNPYAQFRAAFALYKHGDRTQPVIDKLIEATHDDDVAEIAQNYLKG